MLSKEEQIVLRQYHKFLSKLVKFPVEPIPRFLSLQELREATQREEIVIDKKLILNYPLEDARTESERRELYLVQEELMLQKSLEEPLSESGIE